MPVPDTMTAAVSRGPGQLDVVEVPTPRPAPDEVLLEVGHCGVCGTDLHMFLEGWAAPGSIGGHEYTGTVVDAGDDVERVDLGDLVVGGAPVPCGCRFCAAGRTSLCLHRPIPGGPDFQGAFATYVTVAAASATKVPTGLDPRTATLTEPLAVVLHGITRAAASPGDRVLVTGAGPIGVLTVAALRAAGVTDITVSEPHAARREMAIAAGAGEALDPSRLPAVPAFPADVADGAFDAVIECSGRPAAMECGIGLAQRGARVVLVGTGLEPPTVDPMRLLLNEVELTGAFVYDDDGFDRALDLLMAGAIPVDLLVDADDTPLDRLLPTMQAMAAGDHPTKPMVSPR